MPNSEHNWHINCGRYLVKRDNQWFHEDDSSPIEACESASPAGES